jgi:hypothetical protein
MNRAGKPGNPAKPPPAQVVGNQPSAGQPGAVGPPPSTLANVPGGQPAGAPGASGVPPATNLSNVPGGAVPVQGQPGQSGPIPGQTTYANVPDQGTVHDTNHAKPPGSGGGGGSLLSKLKPNKSQEKITTTTVPQSGGPPIVRPLTPADGANGKQTRFSDTAHAVPPPDDSTVVHNVPQEGSGSSTFVTKPGGGGGGGHSPGIDVVDGHNKLRKGKPAVHQDGQTAPHGMGGPGTVIATPGGGPSGTPAPAVFQSTPAPAGTSASVTKLTPSRPPSAAGAPISSVTPTTDAKAPDTLEEVILPDGRTAYIRPTPVPGAGKKGKQTEDISSKTKVTGPPAMSTMATGPAESQQGHCSVCCPTAARTQQGVPIQPCAHQDGPLGTAVPGGGSSKTNNKTKVTGAAPAGPLNLPGDSSMEEVMNVAPDDTNKLRKKVPGGPGPAGAAGPSGLTPQEKAMEDARTLASPFTFLFEILR